ncbi:MAG: energy transducer TonB [Bacteroidetes bacterium GWF2_42_66]|nr:MAG: energy transducer TonB [Bacteroidetes bacterium GWA2_42_15]OFX96839.1 MAG: energy transducer TonB [Bacteroidetes bacterium GWE2_42_39]OFY46834.1 MAG: energy transducer TonB [Bacteroidetes bacterium GWF2_42_66]HBL75125.1 energy transducer TonB [Prolixibacteraceae bacterium]HCR89192.1 energy transducer TonB [Prolixibacteraceae bacterium]
MELKKSPKADLENKRNIFIQLGLVIALGITLFAFEWNTKVEQASSLGSIAEQEVEDEIIPITRQEEVKPPPPPPPPKTIEVLTIVDDDTEINEELEIDDSEADNETVVDVAPVVMQKAEEEEEAQVFFIVEEMPEFPGGELALRKFIAQSIKYPVIAQENGIQGKVYVNFVVDRDGSVTAAKVARGVDPSLDKEALRVVNSLPKWKPGKQRGKAVKVSYTVPINFVLQ